MQRPSLMALKPALQRHWPAGGAAASANLRKGDLVLQTCHVIELVTKTFLVVQNAASKAPEVNISAESVALLSLAISFVFCFFCVFAFLSTSSVLIRYKFIDCLPAG